jgi:hypothetical protein
MEKGANSRTTESKPLSNDIQRQSLGMEDLNRLIALIALLSIEEFSSFIRAERSTSLRGTWLLRSLLSSAFLAHGEFALEENRLGLRCLLFPGQTSSLAVKQFFELLSYVLDQMKTICHLSGLGSSLPGCIGVTAGTISAHNFNLRMLLKPQFHGFRPPIWKQIDDLMPLSIDENGPIPLATTPTPVINTNHSYLPNCRDGNQMQ